MNFLALFAVMAVLVLVIALPVILIYRITPWYKKEQQQKEHAEKVDAEYARAGIHVKKAYFGSEEMEGVHAGAAFIHKIEPGGKSYPPKAVVSVRSALPGDFSVTREVAADTFFRRIGFTRVVQTGDTAFDGEFLLEGSSREYVQALFSDAHNRDLVRALFASGFDSIELDSGNASARKSGEAHPMDLPVVTSVVERLASLRAAPAMSEYALHGGISGKQIQWGVTAGVFVAMSLILWAFIGTRPLVEGWWGAAQREWHVIALVCAVLVPAIIASLWGRPAANRELGFIAILLPVLLFGGLCTALLANQKLDAGTLRVHEVRLVTKYVTHGKNSISYHLELKSWRKDLFFVDALVPYDLYGRLKPGQTVAVGTHDGWLGIEWIDTVDGSAL